jgi:hypothetical protein
MSDFHRYMHIERFGTREVEGIEVGECWVYPKLDGANASVWVRHVSSADGATEAVLCAGSRNRELSLEEDNHGFARWLTAGSGVAAENLRRLVQNHTYVRVFGEWLVQHTIKTYRAEAWRQFYAFDLWHEGEQRWLNHFEAEALCLMFGVPFVPPIAKIMNPTEADLRRLVDANTYLMQDGAGPGEGVVIKNWGFRNKHGRQVWAKMVRNVFKEENRAAFGVPEPGASHQLELEIAQRYVTPELVQKERGKIEAGAYDGEDAVAKPVNAIQPQLLGRVWHCIVTEELWDAVKRFKNPTLDFKKLNRFVIAETKRLAPDLF